MGPETCHLASQCSLRPIEGKCPSCETNYLVGKSIVPNDSLARAGVLRLSAARCLNCGTVDLTPSFDNGTLETEIRDELEVLAALLTLISKTSMSGTCH